VEKGNEEKLEECSGMFMDVLFPSAQAFLGFTVCGPKSALKARWNRMLHCKT